MSPVYEGGSTPNPAGAPPGGHEVRASSHQPPGAERPAPRSLRHGLLALLGRHQIASILATAVDFATMTLVVELLHRSPVEGTLAGATLGAFTNFQLGRHWTFGAGHDHVAPQALRYAFVSAASAALNALGEYGVHNVLGVHYFAARALVAVTVSLLWNFPMQRHFVFRSSSTVRA